jgi:hypothetical protein
MSYSLDRDSGHGVLAVLSDADQARAVIDDLEEHGIPADAISMQSAVVEELRSEEEQTDKEVGAVEEVGRSVLVWALAGFVIGAALGFMVTVVIDDWSFVTGLLLGGIFGAAIGGAAGGMNVAKYASPARPETFLAEGEGQVAIEVRHLDGAVVEQAASVLSEHPTVRVTRV